jgi:uncharacterized protein YjiS (DUF1127 family)
MTRESSHEFTISHYAQSARDERAEVLTRFGFLAIAGADRAVRQVLAPVSAAVSSLITRWNDFSERRATLLALSKLDDRMLKDIGLTRADIEGRPDQLAERAQEVTEAVPVPAPRATATLHEFKRAA